MDDDAVRLSDIVDETVVRSMLEATRAIERMCAGNPAKLQRQTMRMQTVGAEPLTGGCVVIVC